MKKSRQALQNLYGTAGTTFPDNTTREISEEDERGFGQDLTDSLFNLTDDFYIGAGGVKPPINDMASLRAVVTVGLAYGVHIIFRSEEDALNRVLRIYKLVNSTNSEDVPQVIVPNDFNDPSNTKVWVLVIIDPTILQDTVDTTGGTIDFDFRYSHVRQFVGNNSIAAPRTWALDNDDNAKQFSFTFTMSDEQPQTLPADWLMSDARFVAGVWTPNDGDLGKYKASAVRDLVMDKWLLTIEGPFTGGITT